MSSNHNNKFSSSVRESDHSDSRRRIKERIRTSHSLTESTYRCKYRPKPYSLNSIRKSNERKQSRSSTSSRGKMAMTQTPQSVHEKDLRYCREKIGTSTQLGSTQKKDSIKLFKIFQHVKSLPYRFMRLIIIRSWE